LQLQVHHEGAAAATATTPTTTAATATATALLLLLLTTTATAAAAAAAAATTTTTTTAAAFATSFAASFAAATAATTHYLRIHHIPSILGLTEHHAEGYLSHLKRRAKETGTKRVLIVLRWRREFGTKSSQLSSSAVIILNHVFYIFIL